MEARFLEEFLESSFSVAVAAFLLFRMEERLDGLTDAIARLGASADTLVRHIVRPNDNRMEGTGDDAA
ncbi:MAG: YvrJ family protein [Synergistaceae bacterium]|nr:YvrJ family protein [Synergistaceae bacterium]